MSELVFILVIMSLVITNYTTESDVELNSNDLEFSNDGDYLEEKSNQSGDGNGRTLNDETDSVDSQEYLDELNRDVRYTLQKTLYNNSDEILDVENSTIHSWASSSQVNEIENFNHSRVRSLSSARKEAYRTYVTRDDVSRIDVTGARYSQPASENLDYDEFGNVVETENSLRDGNVKPDCPDSLYLGGNAYNISML